MLAHHFIFAKVAPGFVQLVTYDILQDLIIACAQSLKAVGRLLGMKEYSDSHVVLANFLLMFTDKTGAIWQCMVGHRREAQTHQHFHGDVFEAVPIECQWW